jgi:hypothetical protein
MKTNVQFMFKKSGYQAQLKSFSKKRKKEIKACCKTCMTALSHSVNIVKAFIMRLIFSIHSFIAIYIVYSINQELWCLVNVLGVVFLLIELFVTIIRRKGKEPKWYLLLSGFISKF